MPNKYDNPGFDPKEIDALRERLQKSGKTFEVVDSEDNNDEFVHFRFIGRFEGRAVIYDTFLYTLRLHYNSQLYEVAEHQAAKQFPEYRQIKYEEDENGDLRNLDDLEEEIGLFMAEVIMQLEEEDDIKVSEHVEIDNRAEYGVALDASLNVEEVTDKVIASFVKDYNEDSLKLDKTLYSFETEEDE
ncbi:hypothetical protein FUAX_24040 [Fulvitalea axinellae]|uniref:Uncharacterized protein n=1 Tax=Fulvitalea axinellae TaxID=1182444 RepID=A0AAU9CPT3_9BACT|nr:hypothetical protein FUAX_24040 [Fulvitalea axinellae]